MFVETVLVIAIIVAFILLCIAGIYALDGAVNITRVSDWKKNNGLSSAHTILSWVGSLILLGVILLVGAVVLLFITGIGEVLLITGASALITIFFIALAAVCVSCGVSAIFASVYIKSSYNKDDNIDDAKHKSLAYRDALVVVFASLIPTILVVVILISYYVAERHHKKKIKQDKLLLYQQLGEAARTNPTITSGEELQVKDLMI